MINLHKIHIKIKRKYERFLQNLTSTPIKTKIRLLTQLCRVEFIKSSFTAASLSRQLNMIDTGRIRYFAVLTPGHSGSVWLTKLLTSHPDVLCFHEGVMQKVFPQRYWNITKEDVILWSYTLIHPVSSHNHKIYSAIGDVGSLMYGGENDPIIKKNFHIFGLVRNGMLFVRSQMKSYENIDIIHRRYLKRAVRQSVYQAIARFPKLQNHKYKKPEMLFIYSCWRWYSIFRRIENSAEKIYRIEDLSDAKKCIRMFQEVTGLKDAPKSTIKQLIRKKINRHVTDTNTYLPHIIYNKWTKSHQFIFDTICSHYMKKYYE